MSKTKHMKMMENRLSWITKFNDFCVYKYQFYLSWLINHIQITYFYLAHEKINV